MNLSSLDDKESGKVSRGSGIGSAPTKPQSSIDRQTTYRNSLSLLIWFKFWIHFTMV